MKANDSVVYRNFKCKRYIPYLLNYISLIVTLLLTLTLTACGFHLRNINQLRPELRSFIITSKHPYSSFSKQLKQTFAQQPNSYRLHIFSEDFSQTINAISPYASTQSNIIMLNFVVTYGIYNNQDKLILGPRTVISRRQIVANANQMLGNQNETIVIHHEMERNIIEQIINQLIAARKIVLK